MRIIRKQPNLSGAYPPILEWHGEKLPNNEYIEVIADTEIFCTHNGFVTLKVEGGIVVDFIPKIEAWNAWKTVPIETLRADKLNSLNGMCSGAIYSGVPIGARHYSFSTLAQESIKGLMQEIQQGATVVPYKADGEGFTPHTAQQMTIIAKAMSEWIKVNTHYYDLLKAWVERETNTAVIESIHYGSALPADLMQTLAAQLAQYGIDIRKYAAMLTA